MVDYLQKLAEIQEAQPTTTLLPKNPSIPGLPGLRSDIYNLMTDEEERVEKLIEELSQKLTGYGIISKSPLELTTGEYQELRRLKKILKPLEKCSTVSAYIAVLETVVSKLG